MICSGAEILACQARINVCGLYVSCLFPLVAENESNLSPGATFHAFICFSCCYMGWLITPRKLPFVDPGSSLTKEQKEKLSAAGPTNPRLRLKVVDLLIRHLPPLFEEFRQFLDTQHKDTPDYDLLRFLRVTERHVHCNICKVI